MNSSLSRGKIRLVTGP